MIETLSIIIPAYNEGRTIHLILDKVKEVNLINNIKKEVIIVNAVVNFKFDNHFIPDRKNIVSVTDIIWALFLPDR